MSWMMSHRNETNTPHPERTDALKWILEAWNWLSPEIIKNGFKKSELVMEEAMEQARMLDELTILFESLSVLEVQNPLSLDDDDA